MLILRDITKKYKVSDHSITALNKINIEFRNNEFVSILGPSGCGKTTTLNIIGGLDRYTSGDLFINGVSTKNYKDVDWDIYRNNSIGFVFQNYNLISHQTVYTNVELAMTLAGISRKERHNRVLEVLEKVGLADQINKKPNQMSGGQMQRVAIARALVNNPSILLADEPTGALDSKTSTQIMELLQEIAKDRLVIMVTHNSELAEQYSTRIIKLRDGQVINDTNPPEPTIVEEVKPKKRKKISMNFLTALSLSFKNLLTKKFRTILTSFAGSIGIIGIALILSVSSGMQSFINEFERETLSQFPVVIQAEESNPMGGMMSLMMGGNINRDVDINAPFIHEHQILVGMNDALAESVVRNNMSPFKYFIENQSGGRFHENAVVHYEYDIDLQVWTFIGDNMPLQAHPSEMMTAMGFNNPMSGGIANNFVELPPDDDFMAHHAEIIYGQWPAAYNEVILLVGEHNDVSDILLYTLGLLDQQELALIFEAMLHGTTTEIGRDPAVLGFEDFINLDLRLVLPTDYFVYENGTWADKSADPAHISQILEDGLKLNVVGVARPTDDGIMSSLGVIGYTSLLTEHVINTTNASDLAIFQRENPTINALTGEEFNPEDELVTLASVKRTLGIADLNSPASISFYPAGFNEKQAIEDLIDEYNELQDDEEYIISYTDLVGIMMSGITDVINIVAYVLIAFVSVSLVVSSIMIAIITYISVLERTKEIGILRSIGASKKDVTRVFNAETVIIGFVAGSIGILVTLLFNIPINIVINHLAGVDSIAMLPPIGAVVLIGVSVFLTLIAGLIPSKIAAKKDPVVALRTE